VSAQPPIVSVDDRGAVRVVSINRPSVRNAVDGSTAQLLFDAFVDFDHHDDLAVAVLTGSGGSFCSGADLGAIAAGHGNAIDRRTADAIVGSIGPMGPTRLMLSKPVIAAIEGYAVAGGLELACWADLRVAAADAVLGVFCRRWGVPLIDGGTVRLPRLIGHSHAIDLILTGRDVGADEALRMGLVNRVVPPGEALEAAVALATSIAALPQICLRSDRASANEQWALEFGAALANEVDKGLATISSGETAEGARRFASGAGRHGSPGVS
jgi:enoyl-CoA hydratase